MNYDLEKWSSVAPVVLPVVTKHVYARWEISTVVSIVNSVHLVSAL